MRLISTGQWREWTQRLSRYFLKSAVSLLQWMVTLCFVEAAYWVVPDALQKRMVELAHEGHQRLVKSRSLLRSKVWFSRMDSLADSIVKCCVPYPVATSKPSLESLQITRLPYGPRKQVSIDFCEVARHYVLVVIDDYSRLPETEVERSTFSKALVHKRDRVWLTPSVKVRQWPCCLSLIHIWRCRRS